METSGQDSGSAEPAGWYHAEGDPPETMRYWSGSEWVGGPVSTPNDTAEIAYPMDAALATTGARIGAWIIDWVILFVLYILIVIIGAGGSLGDWLSQVQAAMEAGQQPPDPNFDVSSWAIFAIAVLPFAWSFVWVALSGATPGKFLVGARVADGKAAEWKRASPLQAFLRSTSRLLPVVGFFAAGFGTFGTYLQFGILVASLIMLFTDSMHRTVMDRVAQTLVVKSDVMGQTRPGYSPPPTTT